MGVLSGCINLLRGHNTKLSLIMKCYGYGRSKALLFDLVAPNKLALYFYFYKILFLFDPFSTKTMLPVCFHGSSTALRFTAFCLR